MIQPSITVPVPGGPPAALSKEDFLDPLLRLAGDVRNVHALIVGEHGLDLMCRLIRSSCLGATSRRLGDKPGLDKYGLIMVPRIVAPLSADAMIRLIRHSLAPSGRLIAGVREGKPAVSLARCLKLNGFTALKAMHVSGMALIRADLRCVP